MCASFFGAAFRTAHAPKHADRQAAIKDVFDDGSDSDPAKSENFEPRLYSGVTNDPLGKVTCASPKSPYVGTGVEVKGIRARKATRKTRWQRNLAKDQLARAVKISSDLMEKRTSENNLMEILSPCFEVPLDVFSKCETKEDGFFEWLRF